MLLGWLGGTVPARLCTVMYSVRSASVKSIASRSPGFNPTLSDKRTWSEPRGVSNRRRLSWPSTGCRVNVAIVDAAAVLLKYNAGTSETMRTGSGATARKAGGKTRQRPVIEIVAFTTVVGAGPVESTTRPEMTVGRRCRSSGPKSTGTKAEGNWAFIG